MAIRSKGRARITVNDREFVWYVHDDRELRIASSDKRFVVAIDLGITDVLVVKGPEFPRLERPDRPRKVELPEIDWSSMGRAAAEIVTWCYAQ